MKWLSAVAFSATTLANGVALAAENGTNCAGFMGSAKIEIFIGRRAAGERPLFVKLTKDTQVIAEFNASDLTEGLALTGEDDEVVQLSQYLHGLNKMGIIYLRVLGQAAPGFSAELTMSIPSAGLSGAIAEVGCPF